MTKFYGWGKSLNECETVLSQSLCWRSYGTWKMCCSLHDDLHKQPSDLDLASSFFLFYHQAALWDLHKIIWGTVLIFLWLTFGMHPKSITASEVCWWYAVWCIQRGWKPYVSACRCQIETQILRTQLHHAWLKQLCVCEKSIYLLLERNPALYSTRMTLIPLCGPQWLCVLLLKAVAWKKVIRSATAALQGIIIVIICCVLKYYWVAAAQEVSAELNASHFSIKHKTPQVVDALLSEWRGAVV